VRDPPAWTGANALVRQQSLNSPFVTRPSSKPAHRFAHRICLGDIRVNQKLKPTHDQPGGFVEEKANPDDGVENDSLGTVSIADSTGLDENKETGDAKRHNKNTHED
jgi:hypothetical protein